MIIVVGGIKGGDGKTLESEGLCRKSVVIRFPIELLHKLDAHLSFKYGMNRTVWILQAIQEKLEKEDE